MMAGGARDISHRLGDRRGGGGERVWPEGHLKLGHLPGQRRPAGNARKHDALERWLPLADPLLAALVRWVPPPPPRLPGSVFYAAGAVRSSDGRAAFAVGRMISPDALATAEQYHLLGRGVAEDTVVGGDAEPHARVAAGAAGAFKRIAPTGGEACFFLNGPSAIPLNGFGFETSPALLCVALTAGAGNAGGKHGAKHGATMWVGSGPLVLWMQPAQ